MTQSPTGQKVFGSGRLFGTLNGSVSTPNPGIVTQDITIDFKRDPKRLVGQNQMAVNVAAGELVVSGKSNLGGLAGRFFNDLFIGGSLSTGTVTYAQDELLTITTGTTVGGTLANGAALQADLGLYGSTTFVPLIKVSTGSVLTAGQYTLSTVGVLVLSSLDALTGVRATYTYSTVGGQTVSMTNQAMGKTGNFTAVATMLWGTDKSVFSFGNCMATNYSLATKLTDYMRPAFEFDCAVDANGILGSASFAELS